MTLSSNGQLEATAAQLRAARKIDILIVKREMVDNVYIVAVQARTQDGRTDESTGVASLEDEDGKPLTGKAKAASMMDAEAEAKWRATFSICGIDWRAGDLHQPTFADSPPTTAQPFSESSSIQLFGLDEKVYEKQMKRKSITKTDLARSLGAAREGIPPENVNSQRYISHVNNFLSKPFSAKLSTHKEFGELLDVEIQFVAKA